MGLVLTIFMLDDTATGPRTIEIGGWSGVALFCPRASLKTVLAARKELSGPGFYILQSQSDTSEYDGSVYFGETERLVGRLRRHIAEGDFESVICFSAKDASLTKAHIKYLEAKLIQLARAANTSKVENKNTPRGARLSEAEMSVMKLFIENVKVILPAVGIRALVEAVPRSRDLPSHKNGQRQYKIKSPGLTATMVELDGGFVVSAKSQANATTSPSLTPSWLNIRQKLLEAHVLRQAGEKLVFADDAVFSSPSAAASVVLGRQVAGPLFWVLEDGRTYKQVQEEQTESRR
jgi:hypothetical protein